MNHEELNLLSLKENNSFNEVSAYDIMNFSFLGIKCCSNRNWAYSPEGEQDSFMIIKRKYLFDKAHKNQPRNTHLFDLLPHKKKLSPVLPSFTMSPK
jgi:hypothetical protein